MADGWWAGRIESGVLGALILTVLGFISSGGVAQASLIWPPEGITLGPEARILYVDDFGGTLEWTESYFLRSDGVLDVATVSLLGSNRAGDATVLLMEPASGFSPGFVYTLVLGEPGHEPGHASQLGSWPVGATPRDAPFWSGPPEIPIWRGAVWDPRDLSISIRDQSKLVLVQGCDGEGDLCFGSRTYIVPNRATHGQRWLRTRDQIGVREVQACVLNTDGHARCVRLTTYLQRAVRAAGPGVVLGLLLAAVGLVRGLYTRLRRVGA